jgi:hypothetical protein
LNPATSAQAIKWVVNRTAESRIQQPGKGESAGKASGIVNAPLNGCRIFLSNPAGLINLAAGRRTRESAWPAGASGALAADRPWAHIYAADAA